MTRADAIKAARAMGLKVTDDADWGVVSVTLTRPEIAALWPHRSPKWHREKAERLRFEVPRDEPLELVAMAAALRGWATVAAKSATVRDTRVAS